VFKNPWVMLLCVVLLCVILVRSLSQGNECSRRVKQKIMVDGIKPNVVKFVSIHSVVVPPLGPACWALDGVDDAHAIAPY
jgi:hypothetical protein